MSEDQTHVTRNARYGIGLFVVYLLIYAGFVALAAFAPKVMSKPAIAGVNVAIVFGFGLIGLAFVLALVYMALCSTGRGNRDQSPGGDSK